MKKKELKRLLYQANADLRELVMNPTSADSECIKVRVKHAVVMENMRWSGEYPVSVKREDIEKALKASHFSGFNLGPF